MFTKSYSKYIGKRFHRLIAIQDLGMRKRKESSIKKTHFFLFKCDCGKTKEIPITDVLNNKIYSCGCFKHEQNLKSKGRKEGNPKHGDCGKKIYNIYYQMKSKCLNKNDKKFNNFGGRGITICKEWMNNYLSFREWSYENGYGKDGRSTLCRKNLDEDFSPANCFFEKLSFSRKNAMSEYSKKSMKKLADKWRKENKDKFVNSIRIGTITRLKKYGTAAKNSREKASWKCGWRIIGNNNKIYFRSRWEANYARYLNFLKSNNEILDWIHEPKTFIFPDNRTFLPDFEVIKKDGTIEYHEVKGWLDDRSKHHFTAMREFFPTENLVIIFSEKYKEIEKMFFDRIEGWEL